MKLNKKFSYLNRYNPNMVDRKKAPIRQLEIMRVIMNKIYFFAKRFR